MIMNLLLSILAYPEIPKEITLTTILIMTNVSMLRQINAFKKCSQGGGK